MLREHSMAFILFAVGAVTVEAFGAKLQATMQESVSVNPVRGVVKALQGMSRKVQAQVDEGTKSYDEHMCWCQQQGIEISHDLEVYESSLPGIKTKAKTARAIAHEAVEEIQQAEEVIEEDTKDIKESEVRHEKVQYVWADGEKELKKNIIALHDAVNALAEGTYGTHGDGTKVKFNADGTVKEVAFQQSGTHADKTNANRTAKGASFLQSFLHSAEASRIEEISLKADLSANDRDLLTSFLSQDSSEADPESEEIIGILKQMYDEMINDLKELIGKEKAEAWEFKMFTKVKEEEKHVAEKEVITKAEEKSEATIEAVVQEEEEGQVEEQLSEAELAYRALHAECLAVKKAWRVNYKELQKELKAIAEVITILEDDAARELMTKTLSAAGASFLQLHMTDKDKKRSAIRALHSLRSGHDSDPRVNVILLALQSKSPEFIRIISMIDDLKETMEKEQEDDDFKKRQCVADLAGYEQEKKEYKAELEMLNQTVEAKRAITKELTEEIAGLQAEYAKLQKSVQDRTAMRSKENDEYIATAAENNKAIAVLNIAKNRLRLYYDKENYDGAIPSTIKAAKDVTGFVESEPPPDPASRKVDAARVIGMIDMLIDQLKGVVDGGRENNAGADKAYREFMTETEKEMENMMKWITDKNGVKTQAASDELMSIEEQEEKKKALEELEKTIVATNADCNFIIQYHEQRKEMRMTEMAGLDKAKGVLSDQLGSRYGSDDYSTDHLTSTDTTTAAPSFMQAQMRVRRLRGRSMSA